MHEIAGFKMPVRIYRTMSEARVRIESQLEKWHRLNHVPSIFYFPGATGVIWAQLGEDAAITWWYRVAREDNSQNPAHSSNAPCHGPYEDQHLANEAMRRHVAQILFHPEDKMDDPHGIIVRDPDKKDHARWCRWQHRYHDAIMVGKTEKEARDWADRD